MICGAVTAADLPEFGLRQGLQKGTAVARARPRGPATAAMRAHGPRGARYVDAKRCSRYAAALIGA